MAKEQKDITTLDVQIAEFIRSHKKVELQQMMKLMTSWLFHSLDADGIEDLCNGFKMQEFRSRIKMVTQVRAC